MSHRTQLYLDESQFHYLKDEARAEGKSVAGLIREWIEEKRKQRVAGNYAKDPFFKTQGLFKSGSPKMAREFDEYLYGDKK